MCTSTVISHALKENVKLNYAPNAKSKMKVEVTWLFAEEKLFHEFSNKTDYTTFLHYLWRTRDPFSLKLIIWEPLSPFTIPTLSLLVNLGWSAIFLVNFLTSADIILLAVTGLIGKVVASLCGLVMVSSLSIYIATLLLASRLCGYFLLTHCAFFAASTSHRIFPLLKSILSLIT